MTVRSTEVAGCDMSGAGNLKSAQTMKVILDVSKHMGHCLELGLPWQEMRWVDGRAVGMIVPVGAASVESESDSHPIEFEVCQEEGK